MRGPRSAQRLLAATLLLALAACRAGSCDPVQATPVAIDPAPLAQVQQARSADAMDARSAILMDLRVDARGRTPDVAARDMRTVAALAGDDARVLGGIEGDFTAPGAGERLLLVAAADGRRSLLLLGGDAPLQAAAEGASALLRSPDTNGDSRHEALLRRDRNVDGTVHSDLLLLAPAAGGIATVAQFPDARVDGCAGAVPTLSAQRIEYARPSTAGAWPVFAAIASSSDCVAGRAPDLDGYLRHERWDVPLR